MAGLNVILLGAPGAGKGTQAERIRSEFDLVHVSTGDMLREAVTQGTELGARAKSFMDAGELVPDEVVTGIVAERLAQPDAAAGFLLDGFPRSIPQAEELDRQLAESGRQVTLAVAIAVPEAELLGRLTGRRLCRQCQKPYHTVFSPPKVENICDLCGGEVYQRSDDSEATVRNRLEVYRRQTEPLLGYYRNMGVLAEIDGVGHPDEIYERIRETLFRAREQLDR